MTLLLQDLRFAIRSLRKNPGFTLSAVVTLALGIGSSAAIFSLFSAVVLRVPFREPARLLRLYDTRRRENGEVARVAVTARNYYEIADRARSFDSVVAGAYHNLSLRRDESTGHAVGIGVAGAWFRTLGVRPAMGRDFNAEENRLGSSSRSVLVSHSFWQSELGGASDLAGKSLTLDGNVFRVVGVMPAGFRFPWECDLWFPWTFERSEGKEHNLIVLARLKAGVPASSAAAELAAVAADLARDYPATNRGFTIDATPIADDLVAGRGRLLRALGISVALLLVMTCANVAGLLLARALSRRSELAVRTALGATRASHFRRSLAENTLLTLSAAAAGIVLSTLLGRFLAALLPRGTATLVADVRPDLPVVAGIGLLALAVGSALALALMRGNFGSSSGLSATRSTAPRGVQRTFELLAGGEIAISILLLTASAMFLENFLRLASANLGFDGQHVLTASVAARESAGVFGPEERSRLEATLLARIRALPGVRAAAAADHLPLIDSNRTAAFVPEGRVPDDRQQLLANHREVSDGYFDTLRIPVLRGRPLDGRDRTDSLPVCVISRSMANRYWPTEDPVGRRIRQLRGTEPTPWRTVVGEVEDVREPRLPGGVGATWYIPASQSTYRDQTWDAREILLAVRTDIQPALAAQTLRRAVAEIDPELSLFDLRTVNDLRAETFAPEQTSSRLLLFFSLAGLLLASLGTYALLSYMLGQRRREIGIRVALGATGRQVLVDFLAASARVVAAGSVAGLFAGALLQHAIASATPEVDSTSPWRLAAAAAVLGASGLIAAYGPASRAARVDPMVALRSE